MQLNLSGHRSFWVSMKDIYRKEGGLGALYRGNLAAIFLWIGYAAVQFSVYHRVKSVLATETHDSKSTSFVAGGTAGLCALLATYPLDLCRTSLVADGILSKHNVPISSLCDPLPRDPRVGNKSASTMSSFVQHLYQTKGPWGFFAGVGPAMVQIIPYMGINFAIYDNLTMSHSSSSHNNHSIGVAAYAGSISGAVSKAVVYPLDTVKRRLQAQALYHPATQYNGMWDCVQKIASDEGAQAFYRGVVPSVLKTAVATSTAFALFRGSKNAMDSIYDRQRHP